MHVSFFFSLFRPALELDGPAQSGSLSVRHADNSTQRASNRGSQVWEMPAKRFLFRVPTQKKTEFRQEISVSFVGRDGQVVSD